MTPGVWWKVALVMLAVLAGTGLSAQGQRPQDGEFVPNRVIVKFRQGPPAAAAAQFRSNVRAALGVRAEQRLDLIGAEVWDIAPGIGTQNAIARWANDPRIEYIEPDYIVHGSVNVPNDPRFGELWGMTRIQASSAWDVTTGGNVVVGVIDTGVDYTHPDLAANMWTNPGETGIDANGFNKETNGIDDDGNGFVDDVHGYDFVNNDGNPMDDHFHGTHVAGTIAAVGNNNVGVVGVNWSSRIMALKFLAASGYGSTSNAIRAIQYATQMGAGITNNSWGCLGCYSQAEYDAIRAAGDAGSLFVAAAGNDAINNDTARYPAYPASYDLTNIISVAATDVNDAKAGFSNYGATTVDLGAPGVGILSTFPTSHPNGPYYAISGTSMASPHVAGVAALILSQQPTFSPEDVKEIIRTSVDPIDSLNGLTVSGGLLNAWNAVTLAGTWTPLEPAAIDVSPLSPSFTLDPDASTTGSLSIRNSGERELRWNILYQKYLPPSGSGGVNPECRWLSIQGESSFYTGSFPYFFYLGHGLSGAAPGGSTSAVGLVINTSGMAPGAYRCDLTITSNDADTPVVQVPVGLTVNWLPPPQAAVTPSSLTFALQTGYGASQVLTIANTAVVGSRNLRWSATLQGTNLGWLSLSATSGLIAPQGSQTVQVVASAVGVPEGSYTGTISITSDAGDSPSIEIPVALTVTEYVVGGSKLFWTAGRSIWRSELDGSNVAGVHAGLSRATYKIAVDEINQRVYWTDLADGGGSDIYRTDLLGLHREVVVSSQATIEALALDTANGHMYWTVRYGGNTCGLTCDRRILRANLDGTDVITLPNQLQNFVRELVLDSTAGKLYWYEDFPRHRMYRADLDGSNEEEVVLPLRAYDGDRPMVMGLALHPAQRKLYWSEFGGIGGQDAIHRINLDGSGDEIVVYPSETAYEPAIDPLEDKLYWVQRSGLIWRSGTDGAGIESLNLNGRDLALYLGSPPAAVDDAFETTVDTTLGRVSSDPDDLLDNDTLGVPPATLTSFGGGALGGSVTDNAAGATVALAGGTLTVNGDGSFALATPTVAGSFTFEYRLTNSAGTSDARVTIAVRKATTTTTVVCGPGPFTYTGSAIEPCSATVTGPGLNQVLPVTYSNNVNAGTATASAEFAETATYLGSSGSTTFTIAQATSTTIVSCEAGPFTYTGDPITPCSATVTGAGGLNLALPVTYSNNVAAGIATASAIYPGDANHVASADAREFTIRPRDALVRYIGQLNWVTSGTSSTTARVTLSASVQDPTGSALVGARMDFIDPLTGQAYASGVTVAPVSGAPGTGTANAVVTLGSGQGGAESYVILVRMTGSYTNAGQPAGDKTAIVTVMKPAAANEAVGVGTFAALDTAAGSLRSDIGAAATFTVGMAYNRRGTNLQGRITIAIPSTNGVVIVKSNALSSMALNAGTMTIYTRASAYRILDDGTVATIDGGATFRADVRDGNPDMVGFTVLSSKDSELYYSNNWMRDATTNSWRTVLQSIATGSVTVR